METELQYEVKYSRVKVKMSDGLLYSGKLNIRNFQRLSDFLRNTEDRFLVVLPESDGKVMFLNRDFVVWAEAAD